MQNGTIMWCKLAQQSQRAFRQGSHISKFTHRWMHNFVEFVPIFCHGPLAWWHEDPAIVFLFFIKDRVRVIANILISQYVCAAKNVLPFYLLQ